MGYKWLNKDSRLFLERGYLKDGQTPEDRIKEISNNVEKILNIKGFSDKFIRYMEKGYYSLSTPVWTNFGNEKGLPVSCFNSFIGDSVESILYKASEIGVMSKMGGGTSGYFGGIRPRGSEISAGGVSDGAVKFMEIFDKVADVISQGNSRRGSFAAYLPIDHKDLKEFLAIRSTGHPIQNMSIGVTISDDWMQSMIDGDIEKRGVWAKVIQKRFETGYPYIYFTDTVNKNKPEVYKDKGKYIYSSNLCSEITLPSTEKESFVCVLSSLNLVKWDEIVETDAIETLIFFLDAVNEEFINKTSSIKFMECAHRFAKNHRALGMGVLGWHSYLQSKMIPFESMDAKMLNNSIFKTIRERAFSASKDLADKFGEPEVLKGYGRRNTTLLSVAPTTSSSFILGQISPSIEPLNSNYFVKKLAKGNFTYRNPYLEALLEEKGENNKNIWLSILKNGGSVQHLEFLTKEEKDVFKTFGEISQLEIIIQASQRQKYIDQSQSLNLMIHPKTPLKEVNSLMIEAWKLGVKTLYYQRGTNPSQELARNLMECSSCSS